MKFFLDTANIAVIERWESLGVVSGVTTNPSIIAKTGRDHASVIADICAVVSGPVSAEVIALEAEAMVLEGKALHNIARDKVVVKLPLTFEGLKACNLLTREGIPVNVTLCFSPAQALLASRAGATYISPFVGRLDDIGEDGVGLIRQMRQIFDRIEEGHRSMILAASLRHKEHVVDVALAGADVATVPPVVMDGLLVHPLTDRGLEIFMQDWKKAQQGMNS